MTENYLILAAILTFVYVLVWDSPLVLVAVVVLAALGLASGYGLLPAWQG